ncbi:hypothetical protein AC628_20570 [Bradyrhizobium sp. NAS96.2]|nr:hypothetical protein AC628_20570 [Bradyrhizobium sp. NAS96.2]
MQIELVNNFAAQAVIAIENARLFNETKEALERQTATSDILKVIASSPSDVQPVFDAIAERSNRLMDGHSTAVHRFINEMVELVSFTPVSAEADAVLQAAFPRPLAQYPMFDLVSNGNTEQLRDVEAVEAEAMAGASLAMVRHVARARGFRSVLVTPLPGKKGPIGLISVTRKEPSTFAPHHVQLLQTFADQAVIAIENARLFDEVQARTRDLQESLQQQTATSEVLRVISNSLGELKPVFSSMLENAVRICDAQFGNLFLVDGDTARWEAGVGTPSSLVEYFTQSESFRPTPGSHLDRVMRTRQVSHTADDTSEPVVGAAAHLGGARSTVCVPMVKDDALVGTIFIYRTEVRPFTDKQIDLVKNFAAQAVIAIENARLLRELRQRTDDLTEALTYQTGSSNILRVIASSPTDVKPVLQAIVGSACELCEAADAVVVLKEDNSLVFAAHHGPIPVLLNKRAISRGSATGRAVVDRVPVHIHDALSDENNEFPEVRELSVTQGIRSVLSVPMMREEESIGAILLRRTEVHPFNDKQIELLKSFADQAVIAINNVRLFEQVQARTQELSKSLDDLRTAQDRLIQTEKLASLGQLTAGIAHEIKNPLNFVNNFSALSVELTDELNDALKQAALAEQLRKEVDELTGLLKSNLEKVVQHGKRADSIVKNMLLHSREGSGELRAADINGLVEESLNLAYHGARAEKSGFTITLQREFDASAGSAELYPQEITRALLNLISNGFYAATRRKAENGEGAFEPTLSAKTRNLGTSVEIRILDNGTGIPPEVKEKMFNPFFTTKPTGEGTGLGLSMAHDIIVKQHGGRIDVETEPGVFTEFIITLPRGNGTANS